MSYTNADGLYVRTFRDQGELSDNGAVLAGERRQLVLTIDDATEVPSSAATPLPDEAFIPANAYITGAYIMVDTAFTSDGAATLTVGLYEADGNAIDADGIDAAVALTAIDGDGDVVNCDGDMVAGVVRPSANAYVKANYGTAAFTAGAAKVVIDWILV